LQENERKHFQQSFFIISSLFTSLFFLLENNKLESDSLIYLRHCFASVV
jgi:hypothetical protein